MKKTTILTIKIGFSTLSLFLLIIRMFNLWNVTIDITTITIFVLIIIPWFLPFIKSIELFGSKINLASELMADKHINDIKIVSEEDEIKFNKQIEKEIPLKNNDKFISFRARINYEIEAGAAFLMKIKINDTFLSLRHVINKTKDRITEDGRKAPAFDTELESWKLVYSPDFVTNYKHKIYKEISSDSYLFIFNIEEFINGKNILVIKFIHTGLTGHEAYKNSIIIRDLIAF